MYCSAARGLTALSISAASTVGESARLRTHLVQRAVAVGEVQGFQVVGLTQEVVEMLSGTEEEDDEK